MVGLLVMAFVVAVVVDSIRAGAAAGTETGRTGPVGWTFMRDGRDFVAHSKRAINLLAKNNKKERNAIG